MLIQGCQQKSTENKLENNPPIIESKNMNPAINPGDDFYRYSNGGWMQNNPIPGDKARFGSFDVLDENNKQQLKTIIEEATLKASGQKGSNLQKVGYFYSSGMDTIAVEAAGITPIANDIQNINACKNMEDLQKLAGTFQLCGISVFFGIQAEQDNKNSSMMIAQFWQGGISLPERDYYLENEKRTQEIRAEYLNHIQKIFELTGEVSAKAKKNAQTVMNIETRFAKASMNKIEQRDPIKTYNKFTPEEIQKLTPRFNWKAYFTGIGIEVPKQFIVGQPDFLKEMNTMTTAIPLDQWKIYFQWRLITKSANYLSSPFVNENFNFFGKFLSGQNEKSPRWKRMIDMTNRALGEIVGQLFVEKYFPPEAKNRMVILVDNLKKSFANRIQNLKWMGDSTKVKAIEKLKAIDCKIGYPDKWRDYSDLTIDSANYFANVRNATKFNMMYMLSKIDKPVDRKEWGMTPQTVNAYYNPSSNEIVFPAAILQPPFFYMNGDDAVNYGAIGVVIGHEMTHGFDDNGCLFDKNGNLSNWWTAKDSTEFKQRTKKLVDQFNDFVAIDTLHINGEFTLGENISDYGGLVISYDAFKLAEKEANTTEAKIENFTPDQRFFISYSQVWRQNIRDEELMRRVKEDEHAPGEYRVNGGLFNIGAFYNAFDIKSGTKLYRSVENRAEIW
jgi:putative endopeptidase